MMVRTMPDAPHLVDPTTQRVVCCVAPSYWVIDYANCASEWSAAQRHTIA
jgi:hypothetical protein